MVQIVKCSNEGAHVFEIRSKSYSEIFDMANSLNEFTGEYPKVPFIAPQRDGDVWFAVISFEKDNVKIIKYVSYLLMFVSISLLMTVIALI